MKEKILRPEICVVYAYFCKHVSFSMLISYLLIEKSVILFALNYQLFLLVMLSFDHHVQLWKYIF